MVEPVTDPAVAYVAARAASISGNHAQAAEIYARLAATSPDSSLGQRAISEAISAGDMPLALRLIGRSGEASTVDSKLLLVANALKRGRFAEGARYLAQTGKGANLSFWEPLVRAWDAAGRHDSATALAILTQVPRSSAFSPFVDEESAYILLKFGDSARAEPYARRAIGSAGAREFRVRLALAAGFVEAGDRERAAAMLDGLTGDTSAIRQAIDSGRIKGLAIDSGARAFADQLIALALQMRNSERDPESALNIVQIARFAAPESSSAAILLGTALADEGRFDEALAALDSLTAGDPLKSEALDAQVRVLLGAQKADQALSLAKAAADRPGATADDFARLGDVYNGMDRQEDAAAAYAEAIARLGKVDQSRIWPLLLLEASAFESSGHWPQAKAALGSAIAMAPNEPLVLNFLGYAKLEHGEDLEFRRGDDPAGQRTRARRCLDYRFAWLGALQARSLRRSDRRSPESGGRRSRAGGYSGAPRRRAVCRRTPIRGAVCLAGGTCHGRRKGDGAAAEQDRDRPHQRNRRALSEFAETAFAKINLALHVRERLPDGFHRIETIFAFCENGDQLTAEESQVQSLTISGPFRHGLSEGDNLVTRAADALRDATGCEKAASFHLTKNLPIASGLGGGSADAGAALRLLDRLWGLDLGIERLAELGAGLGADVPACIRSETARGDGKGDEIEPVELGLSGTPVLLVNPRVELSTADVFAKWHGDDGGALGDWRQGRNDLESAATAIAPQIGGILAWLSAQRGASHVRMSGSGATCYALFESDAARDATQMAVPREWWHLATRLR